MNYEALITDNRRSDDYVNITAWCKAFDKQYIRLSETKWFKQYLVSLEQTIGITDRLVDTSAGKRSGTYVHPRVAIRVAQWLSPEFAVVVDGVFERYLKGDITLATEIVERGNYTKKELDEHVKRAIAMGHYKTSRTLLGDECKARQFEGKHYSQKEVIFSQAADVPIGGRPMMAEEQAKVIDALQTLALTKLKKKPELMKQKAVNNIRETVTNVINYLLDD